MVVSVKSREELVEMVAECVIDRKGREAVEQEKIRLAEDERAERMRREEFEMRKWEAEQRRLEAEEAERETRREAERVEKEAGEMAEKAERERLALKAAEDKQLKEQELALKQEKLAKMEKWEREKRELEEKRKAEELKRLNSLEYKAKLFGDALRGTIARMPSDVIDLIPWLRNVERLFADFRISEDLKVHLLKPHLTEQARNLIARMDPDDASRYANVKRMLLHEFRMSPSALLDRFNGLTRNGNETFTLYGNKLRSVLSYYVESRKAEKFDLLLELLICDRIKSQLSEGALRYIMSLENQADLGWLRLDKLVESLDVFYSTHSLFDKPRWSQSAVSGAKVQKGAPARPPPPVRNNNVKVGGQLAKGDRPSESKSSPRRCFVCNSTGHLANYHQINSSSDVSVNAGAKGSLLVSCDARLVLILLKPRVLLHPIRVLVQKLLRYL
jgi:hypothetical protein